jgi:hypothetical protein
MLWLKRNLVLVVVGAVALALLAAGGLYLLGGIKDNKEQDTLVGQKEEDLKRLSRTKPSPSASNIAKAREEASKAQAAIQAAKKHFRPVPAKPVSGQEFRTLLDTTTFNLRRKAEQFGRRLPETNYWFTFASQKDKAKYAPGSFPALPEMLADIEALCSTVFESKSDLLNLRRVRVTIDDSPGLADFTELSPLTNRLTRMVLTPYELKLGCFNRELGTLLEDLAKSPHGFITRVLAVELGERPVEVKLEPKADQPTAARPPVRPGAPPEPVSNPAVLVPQRLIAYLLVEVPRPLPEEPRPGRPGRRAPPIISQ